MGQRVVDGHMVEIGPEWVEQGPGIGGPGYRAHGRQVHAYAGTFFDAGPGKQYGGGTLVVNAQLSVGDVSNLWNVRSYEGPNTAVSPYIGIYGAVQNAR